MTALMTEAGAWLRQAVSGNASVASVRRPAAELVRAVRRIPDWMVDGALATVFLAALLIEQAVATPPPPARLALAVMLDLVIAGGLALRRKIPLTAYFLGTLALVAGATWTGHGVVAPYPNLIGIYSLGLYARPARAWLGLLLVAPSIFIYFSRGEPAAHGSDLTGTLLSWVLAWAVGYASARRREEQQAARQAMRQQTVADERSRLARELHDLVGHTVNVMVVQAGAARLVLDRDQEKTREVLASLELTGRQALTELDRMLGVLRRDDSPGVLHRGGGPQSGSGSHADDEDLTMPGIADLPRLAQRMTEAGIRVTVQIEPPPPQAARSIDLSVYRITQEALTNSMKHGHARSASVTVRLAGDALALEVCDDGRGAPAGYQPGRGLLGIAERVSALGGSLAHGASETGGFRLRAVLPLP